MNIDLNKIIEMLGKTETKTVVVFGDFCLDKYMYSDPKEDDISVESGMPAWQVYEKKMAAGAAGTITNNLLALGAKVICVGFSGDDGEGFEMRKCLVQGGACVDYMVVTDTLSTPTYLKTMRLTEDGTYEENVRFDYRNRNSPAEELSVKLLENLKAAVAVADGVVISDQFYERNSGAIGDYIRQHLNGLMEEANIPFLVDSRAFAAEYRNAFIKCNNYELMNYCGFKGNPENREEVIACAKELEKTVGHSSFVTCNKDGILVLDNGAFAVPTYPVGEKIDVTGAGDASNAGIILSLALGLTPVCAAMVACAVSSITIEKIGETGTASVPQVIERVKFIKGMIDSRK